MKKSRYAQGASIARVRSDLLEVPTGALPVIRAFQTDKPQMRNLRQRFFSWLIISCLLVIRPESMLRAEVTSHNPTS
jgi:hypothetical protein